jgi:hypothetical protein
MAMVVVEVQGRLRRVFGTWRLLFSELWRSDTFMLVQLGFFAAISENFAS